MDEPLFGERKPTTRFLIWITAIVVVGLAILTVSVAVIMGFLENKFNFAIAVSVIILLGAVGLLFKWWNAGELDPKFNYFLAYFVFAFIVVCISAQFFIWAKEKQCPIVPTCDGFYSFATSQCFINSTNCYSPVNQINPCACFDFVSATATCVNVTNPIFSDRDEMRKNVINRILK